MASSRSPLSSRTDSATEGGFGAAGAGVGGGGGGGGAAVTMAGSGAGGSATGSGGGEREVRLRGMPWVQAPGSAVGEACSGAGSWGAGSGTATAAGGSSGAGSTGGDISAAGLSGGRVSGIEGSVRVRRSHFGCRVGWRLFRWAFRRGLRQGRFRTERPPAQPVEVLPPMAPPARACFPPWAPAVGSTGAASGSGGRVLRPTVREVPVRGEFAVGSGDGGSSGVALRLRWCHRVSCRCWRFRLGLSGRGRFQGRKLDVRRRFRRGSVIGSSAVR